MRDMTSWILVTIGSGDGLMHQLKQTYNSWHSLDGNFTGCVSSEDIDLIKIEIKCRWNQTTKVIHYCDVIMGVRWHLKSPASQLFTQPFVQAQIKKNQSSASLAFVRGIHQWPVNSPYKWPVTRKMFPSDDIIMRHTFWRPKDRFSPSKNLTQPPYMVWHQKGNSWMASCKTIIFPVH